LLVAEFLDGSTTHRARYLAGKFIALEETAGAPQAYRPGILKALAGADAGDRCGRWCRYRCAGGSSGYLSNISSDKRIRAGSSSSADQQDDYNKENIGSGTGHGEVSCTHILCLIIYVFLKDLFFVCAVLKVFSIADVE
jgi:hypothetical protein